MSTVSGMDFSRLQVRRYCRTLPNAYDSRISGSADRGSKSITINSGSRTSAAKIQYATLHEMVHHVEWRTTPSMRKKLYAHIGVYKSGNYILPSNWTTMTQWRALPAERLAESVVNCKHGTSLHGSTMRLAPRSSCTALLRDLQTAARYSDPNRMVAVRNA